MWSNGSHQTQISRMQAELEQMRRQIAAYGESLGQHAAEAGKEHASMIRSVYEKAQSQAIHHACDATTRARAQVTSHPLTTVAGAFAIGILLGAMMGRR